MDILPFQGHEIITLQKLGQSLRDFMVSLENRDDDLMKYNTEKEILEYISDFEKGKNMIFMAWVDEIVIGYCIGKIEEESWEGSKIKKYGKIEQLYVDPNQRGKGMATQLIQKMEGYFWQQGATHSAISVFAPNQKALQFYKKYSFEERLITLTKKI